MTADFKAMLVPDAARAGGPALHRGAPAGLADKGVEIRLLHAGTPSTGAARN